MAQKTVIHRIDELLKVFVTYSVAEWGDYFTGILAGRRWCGGALRGDAPGGGVPDVASTRR